MSLDPIGPAFGVDNTDSPDRGSIGPANTALEGGGFVVVWAQPNPPDAPEHQSEYDVFYQVFDASGAEVGPQRQANTGVTSFEQSEPDVTALEGGGFVVTWRSSGFTDGIPNGYDVRGQVFDAAGAPLGSEFLAHLPSSQVQADPAVTPLDGGGFVISFQAGGEIGGQLFDSAGAMVGGSFTVNTLQVGFQWTPAVAPLAGGGFVVVYDSEGEIRGQRFSEAGAKVGSEFRVNSSTSGEQMHPQVAGLAGGGFVVTWVRDPATFEPTGEGQVLAQVYNAAGQKVGGERSVNAGSVGDVERDPAVTALNDGGFVIGWTNGPEFPWEPQTAWLQQFNAQGQAVGEPTPVGVDPGSVNRTLDLTTLANGDVVVSWRTATPVDDFPGHSASQVFRVTVRPEDVEGLEIEGTSRADTLIGGAGDDEIEAKTGNDSVLGEAGDDAVEGGTGRDTLVGGDGDDILKGQSGDDRLEGGRGDDRLDGGTGENVFVFGGAADPGERDVIEGFDEEDDQIELVGGVTIVSVADDDDVTGDGDDDTVLTLSNGGRVILSDFDDWSSGLLV